MRKERLDNKLTLLVSAIWYKKYFKNLTTQTLNLDKNKYCHL